MYGPPPDPRQISIDLSLHSAPLSYLGCVGLAAVLLGVATLRRLPGSLRAIALMAGVVVLLTAPLSTSLSDAVYGAFPTIDKEGSLLFFTDGVHRRVMAGPLSAASDPAARLIGVHVGHLWIMEPFRYFFGPFTALNIQALLSPLFAWGAAALLLHTLVKSAPIAVLVSMPYGLNLHLFRDLNWYTIEKAAVGWIPLFAWALIQAAQPGLRWRILPAVVFGLLAWMNLYLALVASLIGLCVAAAALPMCAPPSGPRRAEGLRVLMSVGLAGGVGLLFAIWQHHVMSGGPALGTPEQFLSERAALDTVTVWPPRWNRLEIWRTLDPVVLGFAAVGWLRSREQRSIWIFGAAGALSLVLALGPCMSASGAPLNPVYMGLWKTIPGFWRVAKPEVFFHVSWLACVVAAAFGLRSMRPSQRTLATCAALMATFWVLGARTHAAFPGFSEPTVLQLDEQWHQRRQGAAPR